MEEESLFNAMEIPIDGELDLHTFRPGEAASVVEGYIEACLEKGIFELRIIHGKGKGVLLRTVHARLQKHPAVLDFALDSGPSGWGATTVTLKKESGAYESRFMKDM
jgi:DNA-nicking Smr family endonuclease